MVHPATGPRIAPVPEIADGQTRLNAGARWRFSALANFQIGISELEISLTRQS